MGIHTKSPTADSPPTVKEPSGTGKSVEIDCLQDLAGCTEANNAIITRGLPMATDKAGSLREATKSDAVFVNILRGLGNNYADSILADMATRKAGASLENAGPMAGVSPDPTYAVDMRQKAGANLAAAVEKPALAKSYAGMITGPKFGGDGTA